ncbi:hypothetical protein [Desulfobacula sp.]|uniref:UPF0280 family protein n=1 Tax=Desulfobacula sp. TaxID=2593537 RepID=UPI00261B2933|nr:hypothetical protein [Desulfobacula sp.]
MTDQLIVTLEDQTGVMAENGPMRIIIQAWDHKQPQARLAFKAAEFAFACLEQVAAHHDILKQVHCHLPDELPPIPRVMVESVMATGEKDLTPMAAVAGSISDAVADWLFNRGMSRVIVNNGGDIAIRLAENETARVGIRTHIQQSSISHIVELSSRHPSWGVNTSGLGGRSLTRGIASAVTAFAKTSALSDATATAIANACFARDEAIVQAMAQTIDPYTDISGIPVTVKVGHLKTSTITQAMTTALTKAEHYIKMGLIKGALISVGKTLVLTHDFNIRIAPLISA